MRSFRCDDATRGLGVPARLPGPLIVATHLSPHHLATMSLNPMNPTITVYNHRGTPGSTEELQLGQPSPARTSYLVRLFPALNDNEGTSLTVGEGRVAADSAVENDLLAAIRGCADAAGRTAG